MRRKISRIGIFGTSYPYGPVSFQVPVSFHQHRLRWYAACRMIRRYILPVHDVRICRSPAPVVSGCFCYSFWKWRNSHAHVDRKARKSERYLLVSTYHLRGDPRYRTGAEAAVHTWSIHDRYIGVVSLDILNSEEVICCDVAMFVNQVHFVKCNKHSFALCVV